MSIFSINFRKVINWMNCSVRKDKFFSIYYKATRRGVSIDHVSTLDDVYIQMEKFVLVIDAIITFLAL